MKKIYFIVLVIIIGIVTFFLYNKFFKKNNSNYDQYNSTRISTQEQNKENTSNLDNNFTDTNTSNTTSSSEEKKETETLLSEFTTKIYTKDKERQNNISLTCNSLNNTIIEHGDTFSFCSTVGKATSSKGYEKADVFKNGEKTQALGGGNCQVSSTLYNAVLKIKELNVTERHQHSNSVPYVPKGKDAAVAYGSYDLKFVNNTGNKIKIISSCDNNNVNIKIFQIK